jgi:hypothetical protein
MKALSDTQYNALALLERARVEDLAVTWAGQTRWAPVVPTVRRQTALALVQSGFARWSQPGGRFVLITPRGRVLLTAPEPMP